MVGSESDKLVERDVGGCEGSTSVRELLNERTRDGGGEEWLKTLKANEGTSQSRTVVENDVVKKREEMGMFKGNKKGTRKTRIASRNMIVNP